MVPGERERALVEAFFEVVASGDVARLAEVVTEDCIDEDEHAQVRQGRAALGLKLLAFRGAYPDAVTRIGEMDQGFARDGAPLVRVMWITTAKGFGVAGAVGARWFSAAFEIDPVTGKIRESRLTGLGDAKVADDG